MSKDSMLPKQTPQQQEGLVLEATTGSETAPQKAAVVGAPRVEEYWALNEGSLDPGLNKRIKTLIGKDTDFVVYLDEAWSIQWSDRRPEWPRAEVLNMVARLEAESSFIENTKVLAEIRCQIGEGLVRALSEPVEKRAEKPAIDLAMDILQAAAEWIKLENRTLSRRWLAVAASALGIACAAVLAVTIWCTALAGWSLAFAAAMAGGVGAWASILSSTTTLSTIDARTGRWNHCLEALARVAVGMISAFLLALLVEGEFLLAFAQGNPILIIGLGLACGASERLWPSLIASVERAAETATDK